MLVRRPLNVGSCHELSFDLSLWNGRNVPNYVIDHVHQHYPVRSLNRDERTAGVRKAARGSERPGMGRCNCQPGESYPPPTWSWTGQGGNTDRRRQLQIRFRTVAGSNGKKLSPFAAFFGQSGSAMRARPTPIKSNSPASIRRRTPPRLSIPALPPAAYDP